MRPGRRRSESEMRHGSQGADAPRWDPADRRRDNPWLSPTAASRAAADNPRANRQVPNNSAHYAETTLRYTSVCFWGLALSAKHSRKSGGDFGKIPAQNPRVGGDHRPGNQTDRRWWAIAAHATKNRERPRKPGIHAARRAPTVRRRH